MKGSDLIRYLFTYYTDKGPCRDVNQDALCFRAAEYDGNTYLFAAVCDGMGGLSEGEKASSYIIKKLTEWFSGYFSALIKQKKGMLEIRKNLDDYLHILNDRINGYSADKGISIGTTMTAFLIFGNEKRMLTAHVGDTRAYKITDSDIEVLTHDHSVVGEEVLEGVLTEEKANKDSRQNQLVKCIGAEFEDISYDYLISDTEECCYMLCSDGFRKEISIKELHEALKPSAITDESQAQTVLKKLTDTCIDRKENDNITSLLLKIF